MIVWFGWFVEIVQKMFLFFLLFVDDNYGKKTTP